MIYTGYFAKLKLYTENNLTPISIARFSPKFYQGLCKPELAPSVDILNKYKAKTINEEQYTDLYLKQLYNLDIYEILTDIENIDNNDKILLCYEKTGDFCHRHILANYSQGVGFDIQEFSAI